MNTVTFTIATEFANLAVIEENMQSLNCKVRYVSGCVEVMVFISDMVTAHAILSDMGMI